MELLKGYAESDEIFKNEKFSNPGFLLIMPVTQYSLGNGEFINVKSSLFSLNNLIFKVTNPTLNLYNYCFNISSC